MSSRVYYMTSALLSHTPSMPHVLPVPEEVFGPGGYLKPHIDKWARAELKGLWVSVHNATSSTEPSTVEFEHEHEMIYFKMRWVGAPDA